MENCKLRTIAKSSERLLYVQIEAMARKTSLTSLSLIADIIDRAHVAESSSRTSYMMDDMVDRASLPFHPSSPKVHTPMLAWTHCIAV